ncbi:MAG: GT4 family glycosyltransferase PelF [Pikeienuella sp.]
MTFFHEDARADPVDVCLIVEGAYPYIAGGVSSWLDWLISKQPDTRFGVVTLVADERPRESKYEMGPNVRFLQDVPLNRTPGRPPLSRPVVAADWLADRMCSLLQEGDPDAFGDIVSFARDPVRQAPLSALRRPAPPSFDMLMSSLTSWEVMVACYRRIAPDASFEDFFWAWRNLCGGLFSTLKAPLPPAKLYHTISTGYAGLFAARATVETGRPSAITEHGIYTNERRIDIVMARWIRDTIRSGLSDTDRRQDLRDLWIRVFESFARVAYAAAARITTLYGANQSMQRELGAAEDKLQVIPNGIDLERFKGVRNEPGRRPTAALIGRVVPIKDIEAFISAAAIVRRRIPDVQIMIMGPTDEDEAYYDLCRRRVEELGLEDNVVFTGKVNIVEYMGRIDVMALTSISEAQPLVLLEAGAARIPCVATDVGSCREIIEGAPEEDPPLGPAGRVAPVMDAEAIGEAIADLLADDELRAEYGETLRKRVELYFTSEGSAGQYARLYSELSAA